MPIKALMREPITRGLVWALRQRCAIPSTTLVRTLLHARTSSSSSNQSLLGRQRGSRFSAKAFNLLL